MENYSEELEEMLGAKTVINKLELIFNDSPFSQFPDEAPLSKLRNINHFIFKEWERWNVVAKGSMLDSTDCLTLSVVANLLAHRKGLETRVVRPTQLTRYFHAMLEYDSLNEKETFVVAGRDRHYEYVPLSVDQIEQRLKYSRIIINLVNYLRFGDNVPLPQPQHLNES